MQSILAKGRELALDEKGATATEYAIMLALIIIVAIGAVTYLGKKVNNSFNNMAEQMTDY